MANLSSLLVILLSFVAAYFVRFGSIELTNDYWLALLTGMLLCSVVLPATGAFRLEFRWDLMRRMRRLIAGWALVVMTLVALAAMLKVTSIYSRIWFGYWVLLGTGGLVLGQTLAHIWQLRSRRRNKARRNLVLVGGGSAAARVEQRLNNDDGSEFKLVARFGEPWSEHDVLRLDELAAYISGNDVQDVWIAAPLENARLLEAALDSLKDCLVDIHVIPDLEQYRLLNQSISEWAGLPIINLSGTPMTGSELALKAVMDRLGALLIILVLSPLLVLIALSIRLTGAGSALFRQQRHGFGGETIDVLKFRSMKLQAESDGVFTQAQPDDQRVTRVGRFLRRTSLDELPQLFNVLKGEMSLVGPRPHPIDLNGLFRSRIPRYMLRHKVKPGITGWAQVNGFRGITDTEEKMLLRIEHDLWYIQNWSLWLDLKILMMTPLAMIHRNAF
jgi:putative colanic acid biosynthesis UDP-glucose lipid carrier transferase